jgi:DNA-binding NarL/FixJ family response regulator
MDLVASRHILEALADGLDPITGEALPPGSPIASADVAMALQTALDALDYRIERQEREAALPPNAGKPWHAEEDRTLAQAFDSGLSISEIAKRLSRTEGSIAARLVRIGKVPDRDTARRANRG